MPMTRGMHAMVNDLDIDVESAEDEPDADPESGSTKD
jgi:hypothetical protein